MRLSFFERFGLSAVLLLLLGAGGLLVFEKARDAHLKDGLLVAIEKGETEDVKKLLAEGVDPNTTTTRPIQKPSMGRLLLCTLPTDIRKRDEYKTTALMMAVMSKHGYLVSLLLAKGANVDTQDEFGCTALGLAVSEGRLDMAQQLLERGANPNLPNDSRIPLLHWAILLREGPIVHALLEKGADPNAQDGNDMPALYLACMEEDAPVVRLLLEQGAKPNEAYKGWTALHLAVNTNNPDVTRVLLDKAADPGEKLQDGRTLLQLAVEEKKNRVIPLLRQAAATTPLALHPANVGHRLATAVHKRH